MIEYHGTLMEYAEDIRDNGILIKINIQNELDFGYGFYLGDDVYATKIAKDKQKAQKSSEAVLMEYDVDYNGIRNRFSDIIQHDSKTKAYLDDVFECRYHQGEEFFNNSFIKAPIADGFVNGMMKWYKKKETSLRKKIVYFMYWIPTKHEQFVVKNPEVCKYLTLLRILNTKGEVLWEKSSEVTE